MTPCYLGSPKLTQNPLKNQPSWVQNRCQIHQVGYKIGVRSPLGEVWGPSWRILAPKSQHKAGKVDFRVALDPLVGTKNPRKSMKNRFQHRLKNVSFFRLVFVSIFSRLGCVLDRFWWSKLELCWALDAMPEAKNRQIAKMSRNYTAPERELNSEGWAVLKKTTTPNKVTSQMDTNIDCKSARILTSIFY